ncbi:hypothetical protein GCM10027034_14540 [Ramlibacter solisilvae]
MLSTLAVAAVTAVVVASGLTLWLVDRAGTSGPELAVLEPVAVPGEPGRSAAGTDLVTAPPLRWLPPPGRASPDGGEPQRPSTHVMGGAPACPNCGVIETVVAMHEHGDAQPSGYQMHIRMDDGSVRTVQHRGALPAGSRVALEGGRLRPVVAPN